MARNPITYMDVTLAGNLGAQPEVVIKKDRNGQERKICNFSIAINHTRWNAETRTSEPVSITWVQVTAWDALADLMGNLSKGDLVQVTGELAANTGEYTTRDGRKGWAISVTATNVAQPIWQFKRGQSNAPQALANEMLAPAPEALFG